MENAVDALHIGFAVLIFVLAVSVAFAVFSQAREVSDFILFYTDKTNFEEYIPGLTSSNRIVGLETIIPAIRSYIHDNDGYRIEVVDSHFTPNTIVFDILQQNEDGIISESELQQYYTENITAILQRYRPLMGNTYPQFEEIYKEEEYSGASQELIDGETIEKVNTKTKVTVTYERIN